MKFFKYLGPFLFSLFTLLNANSQVAATQAKRPEPLETRTAQQMPYGRWIQSAGTEIFFGNPQLENHSLDVTTVPGKDLVIVEHRYGIALFTLPSKKKIAEYYFPSTGILSGLMSTYSGIKAFTFNNKTRIVWGVAPGNRSTSYLYEMDWDGSSLQFVKTIALKTLPFAGTALPNEIEVRKEQDEVYLYVVENGNNRLLKIKESDGTIVWSAPTGAAPFGIAIAGNRAFVSNWGGADASIDSTRERAGIPWGFAFTDPKTGAVNNGTISVIDLRRGETIHTIPVGLHPNVLRISPDNRFLFVSNGNSDYISLIDIEKLEVTDTIAVSVQSGRGYQGSSPNGLALSADGRRLFVANGMDNAVAVFSMSHSAASPHHHLEGFIPTGAYPSGIALYGQLLLVCNLEGNGAWINSLDIPNGPDPSVPKVSAYNSHHQRASVSFIPLPSVQQLKAYTRKVQLFNQVKEAVQAFLPARMDKKPVPVPERIGEPSVFKHVVYIIKENRTYDQVLGDMKEGNGDASLCTFGSKVTPNQHQLARDFLLLDHYFADGKCSAEGHQWTDAGMVTDYIEKSVRAWFRSYPHAQYDAMVYDKEGFIWNQALDHHQSVRIYGEACTTKFGPNLDWQAIYQLYLNHQHFECTNITTISRVRPVLSQNYPGYDDPRINDQLRAQAFIKELHDYESMPGDQWPNLMVISLPNDHTTGLAAGFPTPRAMVADNDLALGKMIEAITKSRFWDSTAVFVTEDDSQNGWDHISAYRTTGFVISPYSHLHKTIATTYNQLSVLKTIEHILGLKPMNSLDATATPMYDCFTSSAEKTAYSGLPNQVDLQEMNKPLTQLKGLDLKYAHLSQKFVTIDGDNDDLFNRILWYATKGNLPYPSGVASQKGKAKTAL